MVLAPAPAPYREPLFAGLAQRAALSLEVVFAAQRVAGWDVAAGWFASEHAYPARRLAARQWRRAGRAPVILPRGLPAVLAELDPHVVVAWEFGPAALLARAWCSRRRRALAHFSELGQAAAAELSAPQRRLHALLIPAADAVIGASSQARDRMVALGADPARAVVSLQSVDAEPIRLAAAARTSAAPEAAGGAAAENRPLQLLCVARLVPDKNLDGLIRACAQAGRNLVELDLVGEGPLRFELDGLARRAGLTARFHGHLAPAELASAYAAADALALVSRYEPFGVALREGVAAGLPLIASERAGAVGDVAVTDRNAFVVDPDDEPAIAAAIRRLAEEPARRHAMGRASRHLDAAWPLERSIERFEAAIEAAAAHVSARAPAAAGYAGEVSR